MSQLNLYFDDSGSRHPDKKSDPSRAGRDWFALGGFLIRQEEENAVKQLHDAFVRKWNVKHPLHMTDMLAKKKGFSWLGRISDVDHDRFWSDYKVLLATVPVRGIACVIDRPGYVARGYLNTHRANKWLLCRSAFDILVERSIKIAQLEGRRLGIVFEGSVGVNDTIKSYFANLKMKGLEFNVEKSAKYSPLTKDDVCRTLTTIEYKDKSSKLLQIADSYVYAIARSGYDKHFHVYRRLRDAGRLVNTGLDNHQINSMGIKYYCFDFKHTTNKKAGEIPG
jgi:hypothetical protein